VLPTAAPYVSMADATYSLAIGEVIEIHGLYSTIDKKYHLGVVRQ